MITSFMSSGKSASHSEDLLHQLVHYDVIVLMDDSDSMRGPRWEQAKKVMRGVVKKAVEYDRDGIEIRFLNSKTWGIVKSKDEVKGLFKGVKPQHSTPLGRRLNDLCTAHLQALESGKTPQKRCLIIAITDGAPSDKPLVYSTIKNTAERLGKSGAPLAQLGIQFVQIGDDRGAALFLKELDDNLKGDKEGQVERDIVDTVPYSGVHLTSEGLVKILAGAINRKVDNQTSK